MAGKLVECVHPHHAGNRQVSPEEIVCQTWATSKGVCGECCTDDGPADTRETASAWESRRVEQCIGCPAEGHG